LTIQPGISIGGDSLPKLFVCFRERNEPKKFHHDLSRFTNLHCVSRPSGKMTSDYMQTWLHEDFRPNVPIGSLLIVDSWAGFNRMIDHHLREEGVGDLEFEIIPKHATPWFQPLDNEYFMQFKACDNWPSSSSNIIVLFIGLCEADIRHHQA
jgi:hypothetical protein